MLVDWNCPQKLLTYKQESVDGENGCEDIRKLYNRTKALKTLETIKPYLSSV